MPPIPGGRVAVYCHVESVNGKIGFLLEGVIGGEEGP